MNNESRDPKPEPYEIFLRIHRNEGGAYDYLQETPNKTIEYYNEDKNDAKVSDSPCPFEWNHAEVTNSFQKLRENIQTNTLDEALGKRQRTLLEGFGVKFKDLNDAVRDKRPIQITIRPAASELYALPWELTQLHDPREPTTSFDKLCARLGRLPRKMFRFSSPHDEPAPRDRLLFAWANGQELDVPQDEHRNAIREVFTQWDELAHASPAALEAKLKKASKDEGWPYTMVHLLCCADKQPKDEVCFVLTDEDDDVLEGMARDGDSTTTMERMDREANLDTTKVPLKTLEDILANVGPTKPQMVISAFGSEFGIVPDGLLGLLPECTIRYTWTGERTVDKVPDEGRLLFAWSHGKKGNDVPHDKHRAAIEAAYAGIKGNDICPAFSWDELPHASIDALEEKLETAHAKLKPYTIVHILCHGDKVSDDEDSDTKGFGLVLTDEKRLGNKDREDPKNLELAKKNLELAKTTASPGDLAALFTKYTMPRLVVLCACHGSDVNPGSPIGSVAQKLHEGNGLRGIESVIASRFPLSKNGSVTLTETLYESLLNPIKPTSLEEAVRLSRMALRDKHPTVLDCVSVQLHQNTTRWDTRPVTFRPYRGLGHYDERHAPLFFGRTKEIEEACSDLNTLIQFNKPRFYVVRGASGTGKSSLVFAGIVPALQKNRKDARMDPWCVVRNHASDGVQAIGNACARARSENKDLLLIVDQFEEIFTDLEGSDDLEKKKKRNEYVQELWAVACKNDSRATVIVTLRSDFLGRCGEVKIDEEMNLAEVANGKEHLEHQLFVNLMKSDGFRKVIEGPAQWAGLEVDEKLVTKPMLRDAGDEPGALPLIQVALEEIWKKRADGHVLKEYVNLTEALTENADKIIKEFGNEVQKVAAKRILVQLVDLGRNASPYTRRRVRMDDLRKGNIDKQVFLNVLKALTESCLVVQSKEEGSGQAIVELAHEQIVRSWKTLQRWLDEEKERLVDMGRFDAWIAKWEDAKKKEQSFFLRDGELAMAIDLRKKYLGELRQDELDLVARSEEAERKRQEALRDAFLVVLAGSLVAKNQTVWASKVLLEVRAPAQVSGWFNASLDVRRKLRLWSLIKDESASDVRAIILSCQDKFEQRPDGRFVLVENNVGALLWSATTNPTDETLASEDASDHEKDQEDTPMRPTPYADDGSLFWAPRGKGKPKEIATYVKLLDRSPDGQHLLFSVENQVALWNAKQPTKIPFFGDEEASPVMADHGGFERDGRSIWVHTTPIENGYGIDLFTTYTLEGSVIDTCQPYSSVDRSDHFVRDGSGLVRIAIDRRYVVAIGQDDLDDLEESAPDAEQQLSEGYIWRLDPWTDLLFLGSGKKAKFTADSAYVEIVEENASRTVAIHALRATVEGERQLVPRKGFPSNPVAESHTMDGKRSAAIRQHLFNDPEVRQLVTRLYVRSEVPSELPVELRGPVVDVPIDESHDIPAPEVAFSPDGRCVLMVQLGKVWVWPVVTASAMVEELRSANRDVLPADKRQEYLGETPEDAKRIHKENFDARPALDVSLAAPLRQ
ncbi:MAG TPA: CHAT domain-containing protein [Polyangium sp.]|nr:CHAT domain-containing protein [Polyangium sp.]